jgi:hypothetical protein
MLISALLCPPDPSCVIAVPSLKFQRSPLHPCQPMPQLEIFDFQLVELKYSSLRWGYSEAAQRLEGEDSITHDQLN